MNVIDLIVACAKVPSFSSYEERIHPLIKEICSQVKGVEVKQVADNNLVIYVKGKRDAPPIALTAHLDKINHFGADFFGDLYVTTDGEKIIGQMDNTAGLGVCLAMMFASQHCEMPPLYLLFSEMEEGTDLRLRPEVLKNNGVGYSSGMGARRIAKYLLEDEKPLPAAVITIDTTPKFLGRPGLALYNKFWHKKKDFKASEKLQNLTSKMQDYFVEMQPKMLLSNATNDYIDYGLTLNTDTDFDIPSIAIEPAISPYHTIDEAVYCSDIEKIVEMLTDFLTKYDFK
ncbi:MAG: hypothetical protein ACPG5B_17980 [Chitinophagales bacterium]